MKMYDLNMFGNWRFHSFCVWCTDLHDCFCNRNLNLCFRSFWKGVLRIEKDLSSLHRNGSNVKVLSRLNVKELGAWFITETINFLLKCFSKFFQKNLFGSILAARHVVVLCIFTVAIKKDNSKLWSELK